MTRLNQLTNGTTRSVQCAVSVATMAFLSLCLSLARADAAQAAAAVQAQLQGAYGKLPLSFEANQGQTDRRVQFLSRGPGYTLFLTPAEAVLVLRKAPARGKGLEASPPASDLAPATQSVLRMRLVGANPAPRATGLEPLPGMVNYLLGDPKNWRTNVPTYAKVKAHAVYPGVDLVYYGNQRQLEFDFVVAPGADPNAIRLSFQGAEEIKLDEQGDLILHLNGGEVRLPAPHVYQEIEGKKTTIASKYIVLAQEQIANRKQRIAEPASLRGHSAPVAVAFQVATYDRSRPLVIDPTLVYSTYLAGSHSLGIAVDASGNAYVTGTTGSTNFPVTAGAFQTSLVFNNDAFVTKLNATGSALVYSTYLGGSEYEQANGIKVDADGNAYVTGGTFSGDFPTTLGAFDTIHNGGVDVFVTKLNATGSGLLYSTYLGTAATDQGSGLILNSSGEAYVTGTTFSADFPTTLGAYDTSYNGECDGFVTKLNAIGAGLLYSTYLGGSSGDGGSGIAVDATGNAYVTGTTLSADFPTTAGAFDLSPNGDVDAFVTKLNATGSALLYSTYLGGSALDGTRGIAVDVTGNAYMTGETLSADFPTTAGTFDASHNGDLDAFVTKLNETGSALVYSTYLGGNSTDAGSGIILDAAGDAYVSGHTGSTNFPVTPGAFQTTYSGFGDSFVTKITEAAAPAPATLVLTPAADTNPVNTEHCVTATVQDTSGNPTAGITVRFMVTGSVNTNGSATTDANGQATFCYTGPTAPGADTITAYADTNNNIVQDEGEPSDTATKTWVAGPPATLVLEPATATNEVETQHCVTATVRDAFGNPTPGVTVRFMVTGAVNTSGSATTDANGQATFCYMGPSKKDIKDTASDSIMAYADSDNDNTQDAGEPSGSATKTWVKKIK